VRKLSSFEIMLTACRSHFSLGHIPELSIPSAEEVAFATSLNKISQFVTGISAVPGEQSLCVCLSNEIGLRWLSAMHDRRFQNRKDVSANTPARVRDRTEVMQEERAAIGRNVATGPDGSHAVRHTAY
jgi:hypothetical protein